ncbi:MAG: hydrolase [Gammaproteobacteria bacterium]
MKRPRTGAPDAPPRYAPAWWLPGPHLPTLWAARARRGPTVHPRAERFELPDGDFVDLAWLDAGASDTTPLVILLHGLEGGLASPYIRRALHAIAARGWGACLLQFRGCSGVPNRLPRSYHSGDTGDLASFVAMLRVRYPVRPLCAVGYSVGGNVLLKWLGERGAAAPLVAAAAVSVPFDLAAAAARLARGVSRIYQAHLLASLHAKMLAKLQRFEMPFTARDVSTARDFRTYDERVTAPLHGFGGADDYYARASSGPFLHRIAIPTLIVHARDDPFLPAQAIPRRETCAASIELELSERGGHVGFVTDPLPGWTRPWLEQRVVHHLVRFAGGVPVNPRN